MSAPPDPVEFDQPFPSRSPPPPAARSRDDSRQEQRANPKKIEWVQERSVVPNDWFWNKLELKIKGPIKVELSSQTDYHYDGQFYTVDWFALDANGRVIPEFRRPDHRPKGWALDNI